MTSLKHRLDHDDSDRSASLTSQSTFQDSPFAASQRSAFSPGAWWNQSDHENEPTFPEGDWSSLFTELFASDTEGNCFEPSFDEAFILAEDSVEQWATDNFPPYRAEVAVPNLTPCSEQSTFLAGSDETGEEEIVCYGMMYRVMVKLEGDMLHLRQLLTADNVRKVSRLYVLPVMRSQNSQIVLQLPNDTCFAQVNTHHSKTLEELIQRPFVELDAFVDHVQFLQTIGSASKPREATMRVNINVYGSIKDSEAIGKLFSDEKIFLQDPDNPRLGLMIKNPHVFELSGAEPMSTDHTTTTDVAKSVKGDSEQILQMTVSDLYTSLKRGQNLKQIDGDACLRTPLLRHQQEALDFMTQRESGPVPEEFRLWNESCEDGHTCYRHAITNALLENRPSETGGGVLADTMGLGKTLSVLAIIAKTRAEAMAWEGGEGTNSGLGIPSRATLVVVPSFLLLNHWQSEIEQHLDASFVFRKHHGSRREKVASRIAQSDIVLTTYFTLSEEIRKSKSPLCDIAWFRIVLDEAHIIRRRSTTLYQTVSRLRGRSRWCLTGTPIQNRLEDVGALFCYVGVPPFDRMSAFRRYITNPFEEKHEQRIVATKRLRLLFDSLCLRRTKDDVDENLPSQFEIVRRLEFSEDERRQYDATKAAMFRAIRQRVGAFNRNDFGMFQAQMHLRLLCNHGTFQNAFSWTKQRNMAMDREVALEFFGHSGEIICSSCTQSLPIMGYGTTYQSWTGSCRHVVCNECMMRLLPSDGPSDAVCAQICPVCISSGVDRLHGSKSTVEIQKQQESFFRPTGFSTKMCALVRDLREDLRTSKSLVFSFWTRTLDLIEIHLQQNRIPYLRIDGTTQLNLRQKLLDNFSQKQEYPVLMMTTGTGAFGLNLPAANRVFIVEPLFNPATERQAIARAVRLGQQHEISVVRYVINQTVEQEMRDQQENKLKLAEVGWNG